MIEALLEWDKNAFLYLNGLGNTTWDAFWLFITHKKNAIPLYVVLLVACFKNLGWKKTIVVLVATALLITVTDQLANFFKYGVQRFRPCHDDSVMEVMRLVKERCGGKYGYFSAHAANAFAVASFFTVLFKDKFGYWKYALIGWALLVAYSRIYIGVHYPLDVLTGILLGSFFGSLFARLAIFAQYKMTL